MKFFYVVIENCLIVILLKYNINVVVTFERVMVFSNNCNSNKYCYVVMNCLKDKLLRYILILVFIN